MNLQSKRFSFFKVPKSTNLWSVQWCCLFTRAYIWTVAVWWRYINKLVASLIRLVKLAYKRTTRRSGLESFGVWFGDLLLVKIYCRFLSQIFIFFAILQELLSADKKPLISWQQSTTVRGMFSKEYLHFYEKMRNLKMYTRPRFLWAIVDLIMSSNFLWILISAKLLLGCHLAMQKCKFSWCLQA